MYTCKTKWSDAMSVQLNLKQRVNNWKGLLVDESVVEF